MFRSAVDLFSSRREQKRDYGLTIAQEDLESRMRELWSTCEDRACPGPNEHHVGASSILELAHESEGLKRALSGFAVSATEVIKMIQKLLQMLVNEKNRQSPITKVPVTNQEFVYRVSKTYTAFVKNNTEHFRSAKTKASMKDTASRQSQKSGYDAL